MKTRETNYRKVNTTCPYCKGNEILKDEHRQETYCTRCGYIIQDNTLLLITTAIAEDLKEIKLIRNLWKRKLKQQ